ncbi:universal stress protein [Mobilicoccus sp.]|uniref:universal stress protein n=1 Tax=Mobilicoccus sp. TaxID=2034349 RepID=UPI0028AA2AFC|nr:universal stress protein [Mobilicoccus sp.]
MSIETTRDFTGQVVIATAIGSTEADSRAAERWGAAHAARRGVPAVLAGVFGVGISAGDIGGLYAPEIMDPVTLLGEAQRSAEEELEARRRELLAEQPALRLSCAALPGHPGAVLADASETADLVVLGTRGLDGWSGLLLGSISQYVTTRARGPVAVVPSHLFQDLTDDDPIVLGVDGESDHGATLFAFDEARRQGRPVVAVHSWRRGDPEAALHAESVDGGGLDEILEAALAPVVERYPDVEVHRQIVRGDAEIALLGASARAAMLVIGTRGRGELRSVLFGSTSVRLLGRASCPAVVVPEDPSSRRSGEPAAVTAPRGERRGGSTAVAEVLELERETLSPECRRDAARLDALLADDFHEFGRSGGELTKGADTARRIAEHARAQEVDGAQETPGVENLRGTELADGVVLVTYTLDTQGRRSNHTSIWRRDDHWRMVHRQGTWVED